MGKCLTCEEETSNPEHFFCPSCYRKYKEKALVIEISKCEKISVKAKYYEGYFECDDGHITKSQAERDIDNYLYRKKIDHRYEVRYDAGKGKNPIRPDFLLPDYLGEGEDVIIEYWGLNNKEYLEQKAYKLEIYKKKNATVVSLTKSDRDNIHYALDTKLKKDRIELHEINE